MSNKEPEPKRADFMSYEHKEAMGLTMRTHQNCLAATGVARPGKTAHERWKRNQSRSQ